MYAELVDNSWHWGLAEIPPGTVLTWIDGKTCITVASGDGMYTTPCGTLVAWGEDFASIAFVTNQLATIMVDNHSGNILEQWFVGPFSLHDLTVQGQLRRKWKEIIFRIYGIAHG